MMIEAVIAALADCPGVSDWRLSELRRSGSEYFLVRESLDMSRHVEAIDYRLVVYVDTERDGKRLRGEAAVSIHPTMAAAELATVVSRAVFAASKSHNPWYPLPEAVTSETRRPSAFEGREPAEWMPLLRSAFYRGQVRDRARAEDPEARVNSLELFLSRRETRILNSRGLEASFSAWRGYVEFTVEAEGKEGKEGKVELTDAFSFSEPDFARFELETAKRLALVQDRAVAAALPSGIDLPLILTGAAAADVLGYWFTNCNLARVYSKSSPFSMGGAVQDPSTLAANGGDLLTISAESELLGHPDSAPCDPEGCGLSRVVLCEQGIVKDFVGPSRYATWLGLPVRGDYPLFSVAPGSHSESALRSIPHLEVAYFSDFGVAADSGDFGAEIRLAWLSDGKTRRPVRGGSITGNLFENRDGIRLSNALSLSGPMFGPSSLLLPKVSITGAE